MRHRRHVLQSEYSKQRTRWIWSHIDCTTFSVNPGPFVSELLCIYSNYLLRCGQLMRTCSTHLLGRNAILHCYISLLNSHNRPKWRSVKSSNKRASWHGSYIWINVFEYWLHLNGRVDRSRAWNTVNTCENKTKQSYHESRHLNGNDRSQRLNCMIISTF